MSNGVTVAQFINKWERVDLPERAASHEHFIDLCRLLGQPTPAEHDATGAEYTFEKGVRVSGPASAGSKGEYGFADVWWRGKFAWEYKRKGKYKSLAEAYRQLCQYREPLENPPLLIVSDIARTEIHTNFTGTRKEIHQIDLQHVGHPDNLAMLRRVFTDPASFKPTLSTHRLTESTAAEFAKIADQLRQRGHDPRHRHVRGRRWHGHEGYYLLIDRGTGHTIIGLAGATVGGWPRLRRRKGISPGAAV